MLKKKKVSSHGTLNIRNVPKELIHRIKMAAAVEHRTVKGFLLSLAESKIKELEETQSIPQSK
jgi:hypothetical protein